MSQYFDVAILGGGLAGLTLARQLKLEKEEIQVAIIEKMPHPVPEAAFKVGESSVEIGAHYFAEVLGLREHIEKEQLPKFGLRFFFNQKESPCISSGLEMGLSQFFPKPSYQLDRGRFENHLADLAREQGVTFLDHAKIRQVALNQEDGSHQVTFLREGQEHHITSRWVIDASGRAGILKKKLDLHEDVGHKIQAAWFRIGAEIHIDDWCQTQEWKKDRGIVKRRWLSTNHLMGEGYWVWIIPLASGNTSIGIVADPRIHPLNTYNKFEKALEFLGKYEPHCAKAIEAHQDKLLDFIALKNVAYGCKQVFSADRWALTGEAGVFLDPFYSPGSDFIAMANSFITQLVLRDLKKKPIKSQVNIYDQLYLSLFRGTLDVYENQYPIFGNMQIMPLKIFWDYAVYWAHSAFLFIHNRLWDLSIFIHLRSPMQKVADLNREMQHFFNNMHGEVNQQLNESFVDQAKVDLMYDLNKGLVDPIDRDVFIERYYENVRQLELFAEEIKKRLLAAAESEKENAVPEEPLYLENILPVLEL